MSNLIRKILKRTRDLTNWSFLIKHNFNLANIMGNSIDLKLEELRLERNELNARSGTLMLRQRCVESMITDLTRSIKQMDFDIEQMQLPKSTMTASHTSVESRQKAQSQQKI